jgi:hypothetical protein
MDENIAKTPGGIGRRVTRTALPTSARARLREGTDLPSRVATLKQELGRLETMFHQSRDET